jgi:hypothetical protein
METSEPYTVSHLDPNPEHRWPPDYEPPAYEPQEPLTAETMAKFSSLLEGES